MTADRISIAVQDASSCPTVPPRASIRRWAKAALRGRARGEVTIRIVNAAESAELNLRYRERPSATNVLSFPAGDTSAVPDQAPVPLGDVVICASVVESEALAQGKAIEAHWAHIVVHGLLHLYGYDHDTAAQAQVMESKERTLLAEFGFPDPYRPQD